MKNKIYNKDFVLTNLFFDIWKNKYICIFSTFTFAIAFHFSNLNSNITIKQAQSHSIVRAPPNIVFNNFVNRYDTFFSSLNTDGSNELDEFYETFKIKIRSVDNFIIFVNKKDYARFYLDGSTNKLLKKSVLRTKFGMKKIEKKDSDLLNADTDAAELIFLSHKADVDGPTILNDYILHTYELTLHNYIRKKEEQFEIILDKYNAAKEIAIKIDVKDPFYLDPKIDFKNQQLSAFFNTSKLYFRGYQILNLEINVMKKKLNDFINTNKDLLRYNPIIDSAYVRLSKPDPKGIVPNYINGMLLGFFLSIFIIYIKKFIILRKKPV